MKHSVFKRVFYFSLIFLFVSLSQIGCVSSSNFNNDYIEGTSITIGLWLPISGQLYGVQAFNYLAGKRYKTNNTNIVIETHHTISNQIFGTKTYNLQETNIR